MKSNKKIAILGAGNLGKSIAIGIAKEKLRMPEEIICVKRQLSGLDDLKPLGFRVTDDAMEAVIEAQTIMLCVQPKQLAKLMKQINPFLKEGHVLVSVITGVAILEIEQMVDADVTVIRAMPNTAIAIGKSMTCIASNLPSSDLYLSLVQDIFETLGKTLIIDEKLMQAATVLGASGIAFFMRYLRAATQGGIQMGFHPEEAQLIAVQTANGAAGLILQNGQHPEVEIDKVTTPQGCTIEGLNEMEHQGFSSSLIKGLMTSFQKINNIK
ncbi:MAG: pyrroline-5-carboxylate reductase [Cyclobacteriaceae bacterium]|jgi:pyrroline-5-carboxylate reductase